MKSKWWRFFPLLLIVLAGMLVWRYQDRQARGPAHAMACPDPQKGCAARLDGRDVKVRFVGALKALRAFQVQVAAPGAGKVEARFTMEGMDMGFNLYTFRADKDGLFQASVTLPVCVTGRRDWIMELAIDEDRLAVPFVTDL